MKPERIAVDGFRGEAPLRILYLVGCGRSGSTILDTILGNHADIESAGEICHLAEKAWLRNDSYCACGALGGQCPFWTAVRRQWELRAGPVDVGRYVELVRRIEPRLLWLPKLKRRIDAGDADHLEYARLTACLLAAIREVSGCAVLVDSSKRASRALVLSRIEGIDLRVIHLVRDCRGVAWSGKKRFQKDERAGVSKDDLGKKLPRSVMIWNVANLVAASLRRYLPRENWLRLRYEDFVSRPEAAVRRIGDLVGLDLRALAASAAAGQPMATGHTIAGNRLRMAGSVRLKPDTEWVERLTFWERAGCWALAGPLMAAYGYRWRPDAPVDRPLRRAA